MNFQQLRSVIAAVRNDLNLTDSANSMYASQSSVSKQIRELEAELGIGIFMRRGKRLTGITEAGAGAISLIERIVEAADNLRRYAGDYAGEDEGRLVVAAASNLAVNLLPRVIQPFGVLYPKVRIELRQGSPANILKAIADGEADLAIATETVDAAPDLVTFPCFTWRHTAIVPRDHPLAQRRDATLADLARYPIITYDAGLTGRQVIEDTFAQAGVVPDIRLTAMDAEVIKKYVGIGLGVGIVAEMALGEDPDPPITVVPTDVPLFPARTTKIALRRGRVLHAYAYSFIELLSPHLSRAQIARAVLGEPFDSAIAAPVWSH